MLCVSGCRYGSHSDENDAQVRLINAVPEAGGLSVFVDGKKAWKRSQFRSSTGYETVPAGTYPVRFDLADTDATLLVRSLSFEKGHMYTVLALGQGRSRKRPLEVEVFEEEPKSEANSEKARVCFINAAAGLPPVDLVVNNIVGLKSVGYGKHSQTLSLDSGSYDWKVVAADTPDALLGPISLKLEPGRAYTLVAMGQASDQTLTLEAYPDSR